MINVRKKTVLLAMSGGVDSSVSAFLLKKRGYEVRGVYFKMVKNSDQSLKIAKNTANLLNIDLVVQDLVGDFNKRVIKYFLKEYQQNKTPNPCVVCNQQIKFKWLLKIADELGIEKIATGHYVRIGTAKKDDKKYFFLKKAKDSKKDQSYFLYRLKQAELSRVIFPLGDYTKLEIKKINKSNKIIPEDLTESQDACFFSNQEKLKDFLDRKKIKSEKGMIISEEGAILGRHKGLVYYTQGQRYGLGLSGGPFYVINKDLKKNQLIVSRNKNHSLLDNFELEIRNVSWINNQPVLNKKYQFKARYGAQESSGFFKKISPNDIWRVSLESPQWATAKGQSLVVYDGEKLVGGGFLL